MTLNPKQIEHVAHLARIELTPDEKKKYTRQLGDILEYFDQLKKLDTTGIQPTSQSVELKNVQRLDEVKGCPEDIQKNILDNAPDKSGRYFKVDKII